MKGQYLDAILAANAERRSVAVATELKSGRQLLLDRERFEGDLELSDVQRTAMRDALRADRNFTLETEDGGVFVQVFSPPGRCFVIGAVHIAQPLTQMLLLIDYQPIVIDPRESFCTEARFPGVQLGHTPVVHVLPAAHRVGEMNFPVIPVIDVRQRGGDAPFGHHRVRLAQK